MAGTRIYVTSGIDQCACRHRGVAKCSNQLLSVSADLEADNTYWPLEKLWQLLWVFLPTTMMMKNYNDKPIGVGPTPESENNVSGTACVIRGAQLGPCIELNHANPEGASGYQASSGTHATGSSKHEIPETYDAVVEEIRRDSNNTTNQDPFAWNTLRKRPRNNYNRRLKKMQAFDLIFKTNEPYYIKYFTILFPGINIFEDISPIKLNKFFRQEYPGATIKKSGRSGLFVEVSN